MVNRNGNLVPIALAALLTIGAARSVGASVNEPYVSSQEVISQDESFLEKYSNLIFYSGLGLSALPFGLVIYAIERDKRKNPDGPIISSDCF